MRNLNTTAATAALAFAMPQIAFMADAETVDAENATGTAAEKEPEKEPETVLSHMPSRSTFGNAEEALAFIEKMAAECSDFGEYPGLTVGLTEDGAFNPEIYNDSMQVTVARLTEKGDKKTGKETRVVAIVVYPTPKLDAVWSEDAGKIWLQALIEKEANLVAMRALRRDGDLAAGVDAMPTTLADYWTPATSAGSGTYAVYNELWQAVRDATGENIPAVKAAGLSKKQFRNCLESASFAEEAYPRLETRRNKAGQEYSAFVYALHTAIALAKGESLDPAFFENCLANRNDKVIEFADSGEDDIDLDFMAEGEDENEDSEG
jgi:hypothetical protein